MSSKIQTVNTRIPHEQAVQTLNDNDKKLDGKISQTSFNSHEMDQLFNEMQIPKQWYRNVYLGHFLSDFTNWTHVKSESGYSIWKYPVTNYKHNSENALYFDSKVLDYRGVGSSETAVSFDKVLDFDGTSYSNQTAESASEFGTPFSILKTTDSALYIGYNTPFSGIDFEFETLGLELELNIEYSKGSDVWEPVENLVDDTSNFARSGRITFDLPDDFNTDDVNGSLLYWVRFKTTQSPTIYPKAYFIQPLTSVVNMLSLNSTQIFEQSWAWVYFNGYAYLTIKNEGLPQGEGINFIKSGSSQQNKQNFFVSEHEFKMDYERSTYEGTSPTTSQDYRPIAVDTDGLDLSISRGQIVTHDQFFNHPEETVLTLPESQTSYVYVSEDGVVESNITGFPSMSFPIAEVESTSSIQSITDRRSFINPILDTLYLDQIGSSERRIPSIFAQEIDAVTYKTGETVSLKDNIWVVNSDKTSGLPTEDTGFLFKRGSEQDAEFLFKEDNDRFEFNFPVKIPTRLYVIKNDISSPSWSGDDVAVFEGTNSLLKLHAEYEGGVDFASTTDRSKGRFRFNFSTSSFYLKGGNVGINTELPLFPLHIYGMDSSFSSTLNLEADNPTLRFKTVTNNVRYYIELEESSQNLRFLNDDKAPKVVITQGGTLGIRTISTDTSYAVHVGVPGLKVNAQSGSQGLYVYRNDTELYNRITFDSTQQYSHWGTSPIVFTQGGTEQLRIHTGGNIGIGTDAPSEKLTLENGFFMLQGVGATYRLRISNNGGLARLESLDSGVDLILSTQAVERLRVTYSGNVGINTATPEAKLNVIGDMIIDTENNSYGGFKLDTDSSGDYHVNFRMGRNAPTNNGGFRWFLGARPETGGIWGDGTAQMILTNQGYLGLGDGVNTATDRLYIDGAIQVKGVPTGEASSSWGTLAGQNVFSLLATRQQAGTPSALGGFGIVFDGGYESPVLYSYDAPGNKIVFGALSSTVGNRNLADDLKPFAVFNSDNGRVGFGTVNPQEMLHIFSNSGNSQIRLERGSGASLLLAGQSSQVQIGALTNHRLQLITNSNSRITIDETGKVGIGTSTPERTLELNKIGGCDLEVASITSGSASILLNGYSNSINPATVSGGSKLSLQNLDGTNNNYSSISFLDNGSQVLSAIVGVNEDHAANAGYITLHYRPSGGNLTEGFRLTSSGHVAVYNQKKLILNQNAGGNNYLLSPENDMSRLGIFTADTERISIAYSTGYISFRGGSSPSIPFEFVGKSGDIGFGNESIRLQTTSSPNGNDPYLSFGLKDEPTGKGYAWIRTVSHDGSTASDLAFITSPGGYIGMGTTSPKVPLHLYSAVGEGYLDQYADFVIEGTDSRLQLMSTNSGINGSAVILSNVNSSWTLHQRTSTYNNRLEIGYYSASGVTDIPSAQTSFMTLLPSGFVGINANNPLQRLHVAGGHILLDNDYELRFLDSSGANRTALWYTDSDDLEIWNTAGRILLQKEVGLIGLSSSPSALSGYGLLYTKSSDWNLYYKSPDGTEKNLFTSVSPWTLSGSDLYYSGGNVGIGTSSPTHLLHLKGTNPKLKLETLSTSDFAQIQFTRSDGSWVLGAESGTTRKFVLWDSISGKFVTVSDQCYFGINTSTPTAMLYINQSSNTDWAAYIKNGGGSGKGLFVRSGASSLDPVFQANDNYDNVRFLVQSNGNIGVGTASPEVAFEIVGNGTELLRLFENGGGNGDNEIGFFAKNGNGSKHEQGRIRVRFDDGAVDSEDSSFYFYTYKNGSSVIPLTLMGSTVGIGITSPDTNFACHVSSPGLSVSAQSGSQGLYVYREATQLFNRITFDSTKQYSDWGTSPILIRQGGSDRIFIDETGKIGIGITNPTARISTALNNNTGVTDAVFTYNSGAYPQGGIYTYNSGSYNQDLIFKVHAGVQSNPDVEAMRIISSGYVGIGTSAPQVSLHVSGSIRAGIHPGYSPKAALELASGGSGDYNMPIIALRQVVTEADTRIFCDYGEHVGWGIYHRNSDNTIHFTNGQNAGFETWTEPAPTGGDDSVGSVFRINLGNGNTSIKGKTTLGDYHSTPSQLLYVRSDFGGSGPGTLARFQNDHSAGSYGVVLDLFHTNTLSSDYGENSAIIRGGEGGDTKFYVSNRGEGYFAGQVKIGSMQAQREYVVSGLSLPSTGWYRVAKIAGSSGRGQNTVTINTTGGDHDPRSITIRWWHNWSSLGALNTISEYGNGYWSDARVTDDGSNSYLEVYFTTALTYFNVSLQFEGGHVGGEVLSPPQSGGGTVRATTRLGRFSVGQGQFFVSSGSYIGIGTDNPETHLHLYDSGGISQGALRVHAGSGEATLGLGSGSSSWASARRAFVAFEGWSLPDYHLGLGGAGSPTISIDTQNQNVGIGIGPSNPTKRLVIGSGDLLFTGDRSNVLAVNGDSTNNQPMMVIGEQQSYGVGFRWNSNLELEILEFDSQNFFSGTYTAKLGHFGIRSGNRVFYWQNDVAIGTSLTNNSKLRVDGRVVFGGTSSPASGLGYYGGPLTIECDSWSTGDTGFLAVRNPNVNHGITSTTDSNVYLFMEEWNLDWGGVGMWGFAESYISAMNIAGANTTPDTATSSSANGVVQILGYKRSGSGLGALGANDNILVVKSWGGNARQIFKGDGDIYTDTASLGSFDKEDDIRLVETARNIFDGKGVLNQYKERLEELGILCNGFMSHNRMLSLNLGAIGQLFNVIKGLAKRFGVSEVELIEMSKDYAS